jgi:hypothetical protein
MESRAALRENARAPAVGLLVVLAYAAACGLVLALGFDHVSDDDYARVTIAEAFAHHPRLDPSGTSWLPVPFWTLGAIMAVFGRSLAVARGASIAIASLAALLPYLALRSAGSTRPRALAGVAFAMLSPWSVWLGAATVPESFTASATAAAAIALGAAGGRERARVGFALALLAACLSRYEPWPVAAVLALVLAARAWKDRSATSIASALLVALGPILWMAWNLHAHGDALHFFARVSRFKQALGEGSTSTLSALLLYPRLLFTTRPDVVAGFTCAVVAARAFLTSAEARARWGVPLACAVAQIVFLACGNARDGAPAHHAERALLGTTFILAMCAADLLVQALPTAHSRARSATVGIAVLLFTAWAITTVRALGDVPGSSAYDARGPQIERGRALRSESALVITPCAYEHFALIAAYGAPEQVETRPSTGLEVLATCPLVETR